MGKKVNKTYRLPVVVSLADTLGSGEVVLTLKIKAPKDPSIVFGSYAKDVTIDLSKFNVTEYGELTNGPVAS